MTTVLIRRPAPIESVQVQAETSPLVVAAPPQAAERAAASTNVASIVMPLVSGSGSLLITLTNRDRPLFAAAGLLFMVVSVGLGIVLFVGTRSSARRRQRDNRERYLDYLEGMRRTAREAASRQRQRAALRHPEPDALLDIARLPQRRWERRPADQDFLEVRLGTGRTALAGDLTLSLDRSNPLITYDPVCLSAAETLVQRYAHLIDQALTVPLADIGSLTIVGDRQRGRALARALIGQLVALHPPNDVQIATVRALRLASSWDWVKWLPHSAAVVSTSLPGLRNSAVDDLDSRIARHKQGVPRQAAGPHLVVIVDGEGLSGPRSLELADGCALELGIHLINLVEHRREEPEQVDFRITLHPDPGAPHQARTPHPGTDGVVAVLDGGDASVGATVIDSLDAITIPAVAALARSLAPLRLVDDEVSEALEVQAGPKEILGVFDVGTLDPGICWRPRSDHDFLRVPMGMDATGQLVHLDLKESARGGMGPHGLVVGATGSGKSELLRTLITSLVTAHPPESLALLLVDFKGGATFAGFSALPHVAGMVTNLADDLGLLQRFRDALYGELTRRQRVLADAGNLPSVHAYADLITGPDSPEAAEPLPHLLVIIDEFAELLAARPDFADLFLAVGRIGRSIGIHLLLATQRLDAGKIRGLESHLSYRIGLRTFSESESREVLGVPDAYHLPPEPGAGYLKVDTTVFARFKAALLSTPHLGGADETRPTPVVTMFSTIPFGAGTAKLLGEALRDASADFRPPASTGNQCPSILDVLVARLTAVGSQPVRQVWIAPLPTVVTLDQLPGSAAADDQPVPTAGLTTDLGLRDIPGEQRQDSYAVDFSGPQGNLMVLGGALSGKSVLLRTVICALALNHPPGGIGVYCVDYGGGSLAALEELPHVAGVSTRADPDRVRRTVADVLAMLDRREALMRQHGWDNAEGLRQARRSGSLPDSVLGDVFLVIDGWTALREAEPDLEEDVTTIANRGPSVGVHTVLSASAPSQVRMRLATALPGRIELRLTDPFDSVIDRRLAESIPIDVPGRALVPGGHLVQIALPRIDTGRGPEDLAAGVDHLVTTVRRRWPNCAVPPVRVLPGAVGLAEIASSARPRRPSTEQGVVVGLSERDLAPITLDLFAADPHLQAYGESQSGKTTFLRTLLRQLMQSRDPSRLGIVLVDYRRAHLDTIPKDYLLAYCTTGQATRQAVTDICGGLARRLPGPDVTSQQLRARTWWTGRDILIVADDYDLVSAGAGNPMAALVEYIAQGRDLGLHMVTARRTGGACRAMFEPMTQAMSDAGGPGLLFSGERTEGRLIHGVAAQRLPTGRALLVRRGMPAEQIQIAWTDPI